MDDHREKPVADTGMTPIMPFTGFPSRLGCEAAFRNLSRDHGLVNLHACCLHVYIELIRCTWQASFVVLLITMAEVVTAALDSLSLSGADVSLVVDSKCILG